MKRILLILLLVVGCKQASFDSVADELWRERPASPVLVDVLVDTSERSSGTRENLERSLDAVLPRAAANPGSVVRLWSLRASVSGIRPVASVQSTASPRSGERAVHVHAEAWSRDARTFLLAAGASIFTETLRQSRLAEAIARMSRADNPEHLPRTFLLVTDRLEESSFGHFERCDHLPTSAEFLQRLHAAGVLRPHSLDGVTVIFAFGDAPGQRCASIARDERVEELWTAAIKSAGGKPVFFQDAPVLSLLPLLLLFRVRWQARFDAKVKLYGLAELIGKYLGIRPAFDPEHDADHNALAAEAVLPPAYEEWRHACEAAQDNLTQYASRHWQRLLFVLAFGCDWLATARLVRALGFSGLRQVVFGFTGSLLLFFLAWCSAHLSRKREYRALFVIVLCAAALFVCAIAILNVNDGATGQESRLVEIMQAVFLSFIVTAPALLGEWLLRRLAPADALARTIRQERQRMRAAALVQRNAQRKINFIVEQGRAYDHLATRIGATYRQTFKRWFLQFHKDRQELSDVMNDDDHQVIAFPTIEPRPDPPPAAPRQRVPSPYPQYQPGNGRDQS